MIQIHNLRKSYGQKPVLGPVSLSIAAGETVALIGPSGCGKSTLLRTILGLVRPDSGTVEFDGESVRETTANSIRLRCGYVLQDGGLFPHLTARDNVTLMARQLKWQARAINERVPELARLVHLDVEQLDRYPGQLSGGQRQRVGLMRALMLDPPVLLMDEPLGALDPLVRAELQNDLRELFQELEKTVILVTHDLHEAEELCKRIVLLQNGSIVQDGTMQMLEKSPNDPFVTTFISAQRGRRV